MSQSKKTIISSVSFAEDNGESLAELKDLLSEMKIQQEVMVKQLKEFASLPIVQNSCEYQQLKSLATCLPLFLYPSQTFDEWYFKYGEIFQDGTTPLNDRAKVQLMLSRLGESELKKYTNCIAPLRVNELTFRETIAKLMWLFAKTKLRTSRRLQFLQLQKEENEDMNSYGLRVAKAFCAAEMGEISPDELKCLMFVAGLKSPKEAELRLWLIVQMDEKGSGLELADLYDLCNQFKDSKKPPIKHIPKAESNQAKVWRTVHLDFFHIELDHFLVLFDAYSHWPEVYRITNSKAATIVDGMQAVFSHFGLPETLVLSCDPAFTQVNSKLFIAYCGDNDIYCTIPTGNYMSSHQDYLEFKDKLKSVIAERLSTETCREVVRPFLVEHKNQSFHGSPNHKTPAELMLGRPMRVNEEAPPKYFCGPIGLVRLDMDYQY